jgi:hypothetical protein
VYPIIYKPEKFKPCIDLRRRRRRRRRKKKPTTHTHTHHAPTAEMELTKLKGYMASFWVKI